MKEGGKSIECMVKALFLGMMGQNTLETMLMMPSMVMVSLSGLMVEATKANGSSANSMEKAHMSTNKEKKNLANGKKVKELNGLE